MLEQNVRASLRSGDCVGARCLCVPNLWLRSVSLAENVGKVKGAKSDHHANISLIRLIFNDIRMYGEQGEPCPDGTRPPSTDRTATITSTVRCAHVQSVENNGADGRIRTALRPTHYERER